MLSCTDGETVEEMYVTPTLLKGRYTREGYPVYKDFCSFFVSGVVGIRNFNRNKCVKPHSTHVSVSDEAFTVLTLEKNWDRWSSMAETGTWTDSEVPSKWTTSNEKRKTKLQEDDYERSDEDQIPQARHFRGWSAQGIARYNQLYVEIELEQRKDNYETFEEYCMEEFQKEAEQAGKNRHTRKKMEPETPLPVARHELWINKEPEDEPGTEGSNMRLPPGMDLF